MKTHATRDVECPGCTRSFNPESALMLHLGTGTCISGTDCEAVDSLAQACMRWDEYTFQDDDRIYCCPTCRFKFEYMSALLQHVESDACSESLDGAQPLAQFLRFLRSRTG
jgi:hypothetical protein